MPFDRLRARGPFDSSERAGPSTCSGRGGPSTSSGHRNVPAGTFLPDWYPELLDSVSSSHVAHGHRRAVRAANTELLFTCWSIGREILDRQQREGWGARVIDRLSADLKARFPDVRGYSPRNLKYMRSFAAAWPDREIAQGSLAQLAVVPPPGAARQAR